MRNASTLSCSEPLAKAEWLKIAVSQWGARHHYAIPRMLHSCGCLERLFTDACASKGVARLLRLLPQSATRGAVARLRDRVVKDIPAHLITAFTLEGFKMNRRWTAATSHEQMLKCHVEMGKWLSKSVLRHGLGEATGVYVFTVEGLELLTYAASAGLKGFVEQTIAPKQVELELLRGEQDAFPNWENRIGEDLDIAGFVQRERAEWEKADIIICGSEFVREGIRKVGGPDAKCAVVPYGYETEVIARPPKELREMRPLRIATVGTVGLRKGTPYVLQAAKLLRGCAEFRIAGSIQVSERAKAELGKHLVLLGRIPRSQVRELYQWADLFLLPSICEGSATACYEALCHGVPVITTENAGSIVRHGTDGWIVPGRDAGAIAEVVRGVDIHRARLRDYSANALEQAKFLSLEKWSQRLVGALELAYKPIGHPQGRVAEHTGRNN